MRPRKKVVLLARSHEELSFWRMRIELAGRYSVLPAFTVGEALDHLYTSPEACFVLVQIPDMDGIKSLKARGAAVVLFDCGPVQVSDTPADRVEVSGPALVARVLELMRIMTASKRGPKHKCIVRTNYSASSSAKLYPEFGSSSAAELQKAG